MCIQIKFSNENKLGIYSIIYFFKKIRKDQMVVPTSFFTFENYLYVENQLGIQMMSENTKQTIQGLYLNIQNQYAHVKAMR